MEKTTSLTVSREDAQTLQHLSDILHLFHHRNKNQHRRGIWWRHFQVFRKQLDGLNSEIKDLHDVPTTHLARTKKKAKDPLTLKQIERRLSFWQDFGVRKWQHAFSQLSANGRFAVLGLVLLACLAEVCRILGITATFEDLGQAEVEKVLERFAKEDWEHDENGNVGAFGGEDVGEVISRDETVDENAYPSKEISTAADTSSQAAPTRLNSVSKRKVTTAAKTATKKRRKGNAIDDIFNG